MISPKSKAKQFLTKYSKTEAIVQAKQCLALAPFYKRNYWIDVVEKIQGYE
jgi:hypothetical protein|tara:strand:- start:711 stop:863 length:153 start_codon:yes stop_codon:yes gene_type:complete